MSDTGRRWRRLAVGVVALGLAPLTPPVGLVNGIVRRRSMEESLRDDVTAVFVRLLLL